MKRSFRSLLFFLVLALQLHGAHAQKIPGQYIVYYKDNVDPTAANERLFSSESAVASSESFHIVLELKNAIAVAGINDEQYQVLKEDEAVKKIIQVSVAFLFLVPTIQYFLTQYFFPPTLVGFRCACSRRATEPSQLGSRPNRSIAT